MRKSKTLSNREQEKSDGHIDFARLRLHLCRQSACTTGPCHLSPSPCSGNGRHPGAPIHRMSLPPGNPYRQISDPVIYCRRKVLIHACYASANHAQRNTTSVKLRPIPARSNDAGSVGVPVSALQGSPGPDPIPPIDNVSGTESHAETAFGEIVTDRPPEILVHPALDRLGIVQDKAASAETFQPVPDLSSGWSRNQQLQGTVIMRQHLESMTSCTCPPFRSARLFPLCRKHQTS